MTSLKYETITGRELHLDNLTATERDVLAAVHTEYVRRPDWTGFASWWLARLARAGLSVDSVIYRLCEDLEARLGIVEGKVATPDYLDDLADLIDARYGSRYRLCKEAAIDPGHLSRVLGGRSKLSLQLLERIAELLRATLVLQPDSTLRDKVHPDAAARLLAACLAELKPRDASLAGLDRWLDAACAPLPGLELQEV